MLHLFQTIPFTNKNMASGKLSESILWQNLKQQLMRKQVVLFIWIALALFTAGKQIFINSYNNYLIFKYTFVHAINQVNLYLTAPEYFDVNHYGPFFSLLIAPFALMPDWLGMISWQLANTVFLFFAISKLPITENQKVIVLWLSTHELLTSILSFQFNPSIAAVIILSFVCIENKKDFWAAFFIILGTFVKIYGIVGLAFFFFSKQKIKFIGSLLFWAVIFFIAPMIVFSPHYIIQSYQDWYVALVEKNQINTSLSGSTDISVMGMVRRLFRDPSIPNTPFILVGITFFGIIYLRITEYKHVVFRLLFLASVLLFTVLFSSGAESPTFIIAFVGVSLWFVLQPQPFKTTSIVLIIFALLITSFSPSDLFPQFIRDNYIKQYSLKALPCLIILIFIWNALLRYDFSKMLPPKTDSE
jgi:Glycosyltransferase family 87